MLMSVFLKLAAVAGEPASRTASETDDKSKVSICCVVEHGLL